MFWYLATPYTKYPAGLQKAYEHACATAAWLIARGVPVFCPIAHTHGIAEQSDVDPKDGEYWLRADEPFIRAAHGIIVAKMAGWEQSAGIKHEMEAFKTAGKPLCFLAPEAETLPGVLTEWLSGKGRHEDVLEEALRITRGDRQASYGPPDQDFARTAAMWQALFGWEVKPRDVALAMIALKLSRQTHQNKRDNYTDIAGYARCGAICDGTN